MATLTLKTLEGSQRTLDASEVESLRKSMGNALCLPGEADYDTARTIWNAMIDRRPAAIVRAREPRHVSEAVRFAARHDLLLAVRGGGHNIAGNAVCEGGLMIDLSLMKQVRVDASKQTATVQPGATLADFDAATQAHGLATPVGINSTTGIAGLTLGGGFGWLSRKYGLTIDNLLQVEIVTADGEIRRASERENADLFWAVRGGGGNFGVVTSFEYRLHRVGPEVLSGLIVHPFAQAKQLLDGYRKVVAKAPEELTCWVVLRKAPPLPFLPTEWHGKEVLVFALCYAGDLEAGRKAVAPIQALGKPIADVIGPNPLAGWQQAFDPLLTPGSRNYWKSHDFTDLNDGAIGVMLDYAGRLPTPECEIFIGHLGGAVNRVARDATAYPHRDVEFIMNVHTRWQSPAEDKACIGWAREFFNASAPHATGGVYVNFMPEDETQRVRGGAYGANYARLAKVKATYDPHNLFRMNQNIPPA